MMRKGLEGAMWVCAMTAEGGQALDLQGEVKWAAWCIGGALLRGQNDRCIDVIVCHLNSCFLSKCPDQLSVLKTTFRAIVFIMYLLLDRFVIPPVPTDRPSDPPSTISWSVRHRRLAF